MKSDKEAKTPEKITVYEEWTKDGYEVCKTTYILNGKTKIILRLDQYDLRNVWRSR